MKFKEILIICILAGTTINTVWSQQTGEILTNDVLAAMRKATDYMANEVALNGGYLHIYTEDFSEVSGEVLARNTQIWVQSATPQMGELFLEMYKLTEDLCYLEYAKRAAKALIYGQHPLGGWHYLIDFDPKGIEEWYEQSASQHTRGMEEFRYYYGNCTFDDNVTQGATRFLMHLYMETLNPEYYTPLKKALDFILLAQYPIGGWPQRYPLRYDFVHEEFDDYTSNYTLNDDAMNNNIRTLLEAYETLGNEEYLEAARRGGDFFLISQGPQELPAWSEQYDMNIQPDWGRTHEPPAYGTRQTAHTLEILMELFLTTRDRRYLRPIPATLEWMESVKMRELDNGEYELARYFNPDDFLPIDFDVLDQRSPDGYTLFHYYSSDEKPFTGRKQSVPFRKLKKEFESLSKLSPEEVRELHTSRSDQSGSFNKPDKNQVKNLMESMNENGIWIEDLSIFDITKTMLPWGSEHRKIIRGFSTKTYRENMEVFMGYIYHFE